MPPPPPTLPDELLEEIFLRLPPNEPACLVRASLASKLWLSLLSGTSFNSRYRQFHDAPPMLGFVYSRPPFSGSVVPSFVPTTKFGAHSNPDRTSDVLDCRHGRVLLLDTGVAPMELVVWDPMTGRHARRELCVSEGYRYNGYVATVLCAVAGCDHRACHEGPFRIALLRVDMSHGGCVASACVSSAEVGEWSDKCSRVDLETQYAVIEPRPPVLVDGALYFMLWYNWDILKILKYDLDSNCLSLLDASMVGVSTHSAAILTAMEDGSLGFAHQEGLTLNLWSGTIGSDGAATWTQRRVINLKDVLPIQNPKQTLRLIGLVEGSDILFVIMDLGIYEINLKSLRCKKIWKRERLCAFIPYMSFYDPRERIRPSDAAY
ncbi:hypothetical protein QYE76_059889 [Lolium multiflorum]|uniref:F-box domain-containing protein n=1 Tax=Lolium multiflorum TaxID=4521 RepID=A0AAD8RYT9_LOLMU|nr:hypothetical protein QYE76_059889 [Lolium multiflorum]